MQRRQPHLFEKLLSCVVLAAASMLLVALVTAEGGANLKLKLVQPTLKQFGPDFERLRVST